jgi:hypothetical protein
MPDVRPEQHAGHPDELGRALHDVELRLPPASRALGEADDETAPSAAQAT